MMPELPHGYKKIPVSRESVRLGESVLFLYVSRGGSRRWIHGIVTEISSNSREVCCWGRYLDKKKLGVPGEGRNIGRRVNWSGMIARKTSGQQYMDFRQPKKKKKATQHPNPFDRIFSLIDVESGRTHQGANISTATLTPAMVRAEATGTTQPAIEIDWTHLVHATPRVFPPAAGATREAAARVPGLPMPLIGDEDEDDEE